MGQCAAVDDPNSAWTFCPSVAAASVMMTAFLLTTCVHIYQAIRYRKLYALVIIIASGWQFAAFLDRIVSIELPTSVGAYSTWFILVLVAPIWTNAFVYMIIGRMVYNFLSTQQIFGVKGWRFGLYFVLLDITAFIVQLIGAAILAGATTNPSNFQTGLDIYIGGIGLQQAVILVFSLMVIRFHIRLRMESSTERTPRAWWLLYSIYLVLLLITMRIIFRIIEYSNGLNSTIPNHEAFMYCLDSLPMFIASLVFNLVHPGAVMPGKESDFPSRRERKRLRQLEKEQAHAGNAPRMPLTTSPKYPQQASTNDGSLA